MLGAMLLYGVPVSPDAAGWIVARLYADAHADAVAAAHIIEIGIDQELYAIALTPAHRDAILRHLEDCPEGLAELHRTLLRDNRDRMTSRRHRSDPATTPTTTASARAIGRATCSRTQSKSDSMRQVKTA
jgi:hypothetical protein